MVKKPWNVTGLDNLTKIVTMSCDLKLPELTFPKNISKYVCIGRYIGGLMFILVSLKRDFYLIQFEIIDILALRKACF